MLTIEAVTALISTVVNCSSAHRRGGREAEGGGLLISEKPLLRLPFQRRAVWQPTCVDQGIPFRTTSVANHAVNHAVNHAAKKQRKPLPRAAFRGTIICRELHGHTDSGTHEWGTLERGEWMNLAPQFKTYPPQKTTP